MITPISPVSFKSAFRVDADINNERSQMLHREFMTLVGYMLDNHNGSSEYTIRERESKRNNTITGYTVLIVPDEFDCEVEDYCKYYGIKFRKSNPYE